MSAARETAGEDAPTEAAIASDLPIIDPHHHIRDRPRAICLTTSAQTSRLAVTTFARP
jgi:hypothetical protein